MSNLFNNASHYARIVPYTIPTTGTMMIWIYSTAAYNDGQYHWYVNSGRNSPSVLRFDFFRYNNGNFMCGWYNAGNDDRVTVSASGLTQNAWHTLILTWANGGVTELFLDGTSIGSTPTLNATWDTSAIGLTIGNSSGYDNKSAAARIAWPTIWTVVLSDDEIMALARGIHPLRVRNDKIQDCWKLFGHESPDLSWAGLRSSLGIAYCQYAIEPPLHLDRFGRPQFATAVAAVEGGADWWPFFLRYLPES